MNNNQVDLKAFIGLHDDYRDAINALKQLGEIWDKDRIDTVFQRESKWDTQEHIDAQTARLNAERVIRQGKEIP
jgi:hypothetical protein